MKREEAKQLVESGIEELHQALAAGRSDTLVRYLAAMGRFHRYSFGNLMLIFSQREDATYVAGFHKWKELGRRVRKGEHGIGILAPCKYKQQTEEANGDEAEVDDIRGFKIVHVFDISQTEGEELPEFAQIHGDPGENLARMEQVIRNAGIELRYEPIAGTALGTSAGGTITAEPDLSDAETVALLVHEHCHLC